METVYPSGRAIRLTGNQMQARAFLLGNEGGLVLHLPVELNIGDRTLLPIKWFGVSEFGRKYLEASRVWIERAGQRTMLNRSSQVEFTHELSEAVRTFLVEGVTVRQRFFVPNRWAGCVMTLECDRPAQFIVEPHYDMRYYQAFNTDFSGYDAKVTTQQGVDVLTVSNEIEGPTGGRMKFHSTIRPVGGPMHVDSLPHDDRLQPRTYLKDEHREKLLHRVISETHNISPDEAPIWEKYTNTVYGPAHLTLEAPATLVFSFDEEEHQAESVGASIAANLTDLYHQNDADSMKRLEQALLLTGNTEVDLAYTQVLSRFNSCLVARDVTVEMDSHKIEHFTGIFAGDKYFLDAWKRDENISLEGLMHGNDYETMGTILENTWQYQDDRTGRLPHIIRLGQPLVYYSSDGTPWALHRLLQYWKLSGDQSLLDKKYPMVERFFAAGLEMAQRGLLPSGGIIEKSYLWETWEDTAFTPRDGYPVEIELLWLTVIDQGLPLVRERNPELAQRLEEALETGHETFELFYLDGYLADSLDYNFRPRRLLTPNGFIAFGLDYPIPGDLSREMVLLARDQLAGRVGVKSLAPRDWPKVFSPEFLADPANFHNGNMASVGIYNYHRGIEWLWLNQYLLLGELRYGDTDTGYRRYVEGQVRAALEKSGVGGLDELHDLHGPLGADFQAWSMASFVTSLHHFAGIDVDANARRVSVRPSLPKTWPDLLCRRRVENCRFDVRMRINPKGTNVITVDALDSVPRGYEIEIGIRVAGSEAVTTISVNGREVPPDKRELRHPSGEAGPSEVWVHAPFDKGMEVVFAPPGT